MQTIIISISLPRKLRAREGKSFIQSHTASKWLSQDLNPRLSDKKDIFYSHHAAPDPKRTVGGAHDNVNSLCPLCIATHLMLSPTHCVEENTEAQRS